MKFSIMGSGFQCMIEEVYLTSEFSETQALQNLVYKYKQLIAKNEPFVIETCDDGPHIIYYPKPGDHFIIMTEKQFAKFRREQMFLQAQTGKH